MQSFNSATFCASCSFFVFIFFFFFSRTSLIFFLFRGLFHIIIHKIKNFNKFTRILAFKLIENHEQSPLPTGREYRSFETQAFAATALKVLLKSMRGPCAGYFLCGKSFSGLPEDKVPSASVSTLAALLTSLYAFVKSA